MLGRRSERQSKFKRRQTVLSMPEAGWDARLMITETPWGLRFNIRTFKRGQASKNWGITLTRGQFEQMLAAGPDALKKFEREAKLPASQLREIHSEMVPNSFECGSRKPRRRGDGLCSLARAGLGSNCQPSQPAEQPTYHRRSYPFASVQSCVRRRCVTAETPPPASPIESV